MADHSFMLVRHDLLDAQLVGQNGRRIGRADELMLDLSGDVPRIASLVIGGAARANRAGEWGRAIRRVISALLRRTHDPVSVIPFSLLTEVGDRVCLDVDGETLESARLEIWLRDQIVARIPGAHGSTK